MKNKNGIRMALLSAALLALAGLVSLGTTGCTTTRTVSSSTNAVTGEVTGVTNVSTKVDQVKLAQMETALEPLLSGATRRALKNSPQHSDEIALYMRGVASVFCDMQSNGNFEPAYLIDALDKILTPELPDDYVVDVKNGAIAIYKIAWGDRFTAELPPDQWPGQVCKLFCNSINQGLKDAGKAQVGLPN